MINIFEYFSNWLKLRLIFQFSVISLTSYFFSFFFFSFDVPGGSIIVLVVLSLGSWKIIMGFRQAVRHETLTLTFASSILATPAMYVYRNGYNGADLKSAVSALIRHGRSNRPTYVIMQITMERYHAALIRLVAEFDSQICNYSPITEKFV